MANRTKTIPTFDAATRKLTGSKRQNTGGSSRARALDDDDDLPDAGPVGELTVESVVDTREWVEGADDKWHPIPGSGSGRSCDRCGRTHEIHATVTDSTGATFTVGVGCSGADTATARRISTAATNDARARARAARAVVAAEQVDQIVADVELLQFDPAGCVRSEAESGKGFAWLHFGDAQVLVHSWADIEERTRVLEGVWRGLRAAELAGGHPQWRKLLGDAQRHNPYS